MTVVLALADDLDARQRADVHQAAERLADFAGRRLVVAAVDRPVR